MKMSKKKMILREKKYALSCNWLVRHFYSNLTEETYYNVMNENNGLLVAYRMAKRLYKKRNKRGR